MSFSPPTRGNPVSDLLGVKFNRLEVVEHLGRGKYGKHYWRCFCECGGWVDVNTQIIKAHSVVSCGCYRKETMAENRANPTKHGLHKTNLYAIYHGIKYRCYNPKAPRWKYYGGKGIEMCPEWLNSVVTFYEWAMANGYQEGLSIDRVDNSKNYCPENCEWVTRSENTRRVHVKV